ncbi:MAG: putative pyridoxal-dependent aspartate 1-decarboxylase [Pseudomonadota bacterium]
MLDNAKKLAHASFENIVRIFTVPEAPDSTLSAIDRQISENLAGFLQEHIVAKEKTIEVLRRNFADSAIPEDPIFVSEQAEFLLNKVVAHSVHTSSPRFVGHMTSALPYFMLSLSRIMIALNQNLVKIETSKAFTPLERQVIGMLHSLVFQENTDFYKRWMHEAGHALGAVCSGGTIANLTALWIARNQALKADKTFAGVHQAGMARALKHYGYQGTAIITSERGHYSLSKATDLLGIGRQDLIAIPTDGKHRVRVSEMEQCLKKLKSENTLVLAIVGVAGASETGTVDPLNELANLAEEYRCHYHVDAAWGGPTLFSDQHRHILSGIERADTVTLDAHKQMYVPMGAGFVLCRSPAAQNVIEHHADYIIRRGSQDLGSHTLEGSRPGMALLIHSGLRIIGRAGYELLVDYGIHLAQEFNKMIQENENFEIISEPQLNILTYRYRPVRLEKNWPQLNQDEKNQANQTLNELTQWIQKTQRSRGRSFVSRTTLKVECYNRQEIVVFRVVLANPLTTVEILAEILKEQEMLANRAGARQILTPIVAWC